MAEKFQLVIAIVNVGFSEIAMNSAREAGAHGGTIVHARGTGTSEMVKKYGIVITPDKELILILTAKKITDAVLSSVHKAVGLGTNAQGFVFALPVDDVAGLKYDEEKE